MWRVDWKKTGSRQPCQEALEIIQANEDEVLEEGSGSLEGEEDCGRFPEI